jgi:predicted kinase
VAREVILVNGIPGSGKTTLADQLAHDLDAPFLSKDRVKEGIADAIGHPAVEPALGFVAMETIWRIAASVPGRVVIESWWFRPRDLEHARTGLASAAAEATVEIWCDAPLALAQERYRARTRHQLHRDRRDMTGEWAAWAAHGAPLALGPVIRVDTTATVDVAALGHQVITELAGG